jgi:rhamnose transport system permease protein
MKTYFREWSIAFALLALLMLLALAAPDFYKAGQLLAVLTAAAPVLVTSCGMTLVILCRHIDISVGSQFALCSILTGLAAASGVPMALVVAVAIMTGALIGSMNGILVAGLGLPSIVVTLATMVTGRELLRWWREGEFVRDLPRTFQWFGLSQSAGQAVILGTTACVFLVLAFALKHLSWGRYVYAVGSDVEAARLAGLRPRLVTFVVLTLMGTFTGLAALLNAIRFPDVDPKTGQGLEMQAIAAAVVGGLSISGGRGNIWGVLLGVLLLTCIGPALVFLKAPPQWEKAIQGCIILLAVAADGFRTARSAREI